MAIQLTIPSTKTLYKFWFETDLFHNMISWVMPPNMAHKSPPVNKHHDFRFVRYRYHQK